MEDKSAKRLSIIAVSISIFSFCLAGYDTYLNRDRDHLSVRPLLHFTYESAEDQEAVGLSVRNAGLGPAIIDSVNAYVDREPVKDWSDVVSGLSLPVKVMTFFQGDVLQVGATELLIGQSTSRKEHLTSNADFIRKHVTFSVTYHSLTGDKFTQCSSPGRC